MGHIHYSFISLNSFSDIHFIYFYKIYKKIVNQGKKISKIVFSTKRLFLFLIKLNRIINNNNCQVSIINLIFKFCETNLTFQF